MLAASAAPAWVQNLGPALPDFAINWPLNQAWQKGVGLISPTTLGIATVRSSVKQVADSNGNWVQISANANAVSNIGLSIEESRTNRALFSNGSGGSAWTTSAFPGTVTNNSTDVLDPIGTNTATKLQPTTGITNGYYQGAIAVTAAAVYTVSFFVRLGSMPASDFAYAIFDETNSVFLVNNTTPTITPMPNGWFRVISTVTTGAGETVLRVYPYRNSATTGGSAYIWGLQVELGSSATSIILTTSAAVIRQFDQTTMLAAFGSVYSLFSSAIPQAPITFATTQSTLEIFKDVSNRTAIRRNAGSGVPIVSGVGGSTFTIIATGAPVWAQNSQSKLALAVAAGDQALTYNNGAPSATTAATLPTIPTSLTFGGGNNGGSFFLNGLLIITAAWLTQRIPNSQLQAITL